MKLSYPTRNGHSPYTTQVSCGSDLSKRTGVTSSCQRSQETMSISVRLEHVPISACSIDLQCSGDTKVSMERCAIRLTTSYVADLAGKSLDICARCYTSVVIRATYPYRLTCGRRPLPESERNMPPWWNIRLPEEKKDSINKSGTRLKSTFRGLVLGCNCGCRRHHNG